MQLAAKLMGYQIQAQQEEVAKKTTVSHRMDDETPTATELRWKRMVIQIGLVDVHAISGSIIHHMETMRTRIEEEARRAYEKAAGSGAKITSKGSKPMKPDAKAENKEAIYKGKPLSRSQASVWIYDPDMCLHSHLEPRGNKHALWFTCLKCGSRWERLTQPLEPNVQRVPTSTTGPPGPAQVSAAAVPLVAPPGTIPWNPAPAAPAAAFHQAMMHTHMPSKQILVDKEAPVPDSRKVTFQEANTKRKTDDFQMIGLSTLGQKVFERHQDMLNTGMQHEAIMQSLMKSAKSQEEVAAVIEVINHQQL